MSTALGLTAYLDKEREYVPWSSALSHLGFIGSMLSMRPSYGFYRVSSLTPVNLESNGPVFTKATPNKRRKVEAPVETKEIKFLNCIIPYNVSWIKKWKDTTTGKATVTIPWVTGNFFPASRQEKNVSCLPPRRKKEKQQQPLASLVPWLWLMGELGRRDFNQYETGIRSYESITKQRK